MLDIRAICQNYNRHMGMMPINHDIESHMTETFGHIVAMAYDALPLADHSLITALSYQALSAETMAQYRWLGAHGLRFTLAPLDVFAAYPSASAMAYDVRNSGHLTVFTGGQPNPLFASANLAFRAIHDVFGHVTTDTDFGLVGEDIAYRVHVQSFSPLARLALATETRGQNLWVHYGPHSHLPFARRPYALQKASLLPINCIEGV